MADVNILSTGDNLLFGAKVLADTMLNYDQLGLWTKQNLNKEYTIIP